MPLVTARRCVACVALAAVLALGIAIGILYPGIWPFAAASPAAPAKSARTIAEEWASGLAHGQKWALTAGPKGPPTITVGPAKAEDASATAFVAFITRTKFEDVWKHYAEKCGYEGPKESLAGGARMNPEDLRGGLQLGKGKDQHLRVDFAGVGSAKPGGEASGRESHFGYYTDGHVVHVVIEEIAPDRQVNYRNSVKVRIFAALR